MVMRTNRYKGDRSINWKKIKSHIPMIAVVKGEQEKSKSGSMTTKKTPGSGAEATVRCLYHLGNVRRGAD